MEFTEKQWFGLKNHADERGLIFLSSPFSFEAVDLLSRVGVAAWKLPSGETANTPMLDQMIVTGLPVILSTGMSSLHEIDAAVDRIKDRGVPLVVLQWTTSYPCPPEKVGVNLISFFKKRYRCPVGLSDHSGTIFPGLASAALGIQMLEIHVTFSRQMFGPDMPASITSAELKQLVEGIRFIEKMMENPVDKDAIAENVQELRKAFMKSVVARRNLKAGHILTWDDLDAKKPGTGIPAARMPEMIGRRLTCDLNQDALLSEDILE